MRLQASTRASRAPGHLGERRHSRGMVTMLVVLFLVGTVVFVMSRMLDVSGANVVDGQRQSDTTAAFFLAESGLDRAQGAIATALAGNFDNATCTGLGATYALGRGSVTLSAVSAPANCDNSGGTPCSSCTVTSSATVGQARRELTQELALTVRNGVTCNSATADCDNTPNVVWQLRLRNGSGVAGVGFFNLTYDGQGNNRPTCAVASNCRLQLDVDSPAAGQDSTGLMGNAVLIPSGATYPIYQTTTQNRDIAEVGVFFLGTTAPALTGPTADPGAASFWERRTNQAARTVGSGGSTTGGTTDGTATSGNVPACTAPSTNTQGCTSWCHGGDTLVFAFSAAVNAVTDELTGVTFGTNANNVAMTRVTKYPTALDAGAPTGIDAEIWYARNPNLNGISPLATGASSYKGRGTAAVGAAWTTTSGNPTSISGTTLTVSTLLAGWPVQIISPGDTVTSTGVAANTTIVQQLTSAETGGMTTGRGGRGTYQVSISQTVNAANNRAWTVNSNVLNVSSCSTCFLANGDAVALTGLGAGRSINAAQQPVSGAFGRTEAAGGVGRYPINGAATRVASNAGLFVGTPGTTLYLPSGQPQPVVSTPQQLLMVKSGTGLMASGTRVSAVTSPNAATTAFTVNTAPTTALDNATICGGTCAFFAPAAGAITNYSIAGSASALRWASGFTCLKGVDVTPQVVTSSTTSRTRWIETIR